MKKSILILMLLLAFYSSKANTDSLKVETKITEATVYLRGAQVTREGKVYIPKGKRN